MLRHVFVLAALTAILPTAQAEPPRVLSLEDRVAARRAVEEVLWSHRTWPAENGAEKPGLEAWLPADALRRQVEDDLRKSQALARFWGRPITQAALQSLGSFTRGAAAVTSENFFKVNLYAVALLRQPKEKILQSEIMENDNARMCARDLKHACVITMIVSHVIDDRIVVAKRLQNRRVAAIVMASKPVTYLRIGRFKGVDEEGDVSLDREISQKLLAVVGNA